MYREHSNGDSKLVKAMRKCQRTPPPPPPPTATSYTTIPPWVPSYDSYPYECCTTHNSCARCCIFQKQELSINSPHSPPPLVLSPVFSSRVRLVRLSRSLDFLSRSLARLSRCHARLSLPSFWFESMMCHMIYVYVDLCHLE